MSICSLCRPLIDRKLPTPVERNVLQRFGPDVWFVRVQEKPGGVPHHPSLAALVASAQACQICSLVLQAVQGFQTAFLDATRQAQRGHGLPEDDDLGIYMTACWSGRDGCLVFMQSSTTKWHYLVAALGFCSPAESALAARYHGRPVDQDVGSRHTLAIISSWVANCDQSHRFCTADPVRLERSRNRLSTSTQNLVTLTRQAEFITQLPKRTLDISDFARSRMIRLALTAQTRGTYVALSHCWGKQGHFTTTRETIAQRMEGICVDALPRSFQDAVMLTHHLGIQYLWIDSLCICQDDAEDWARAAACMDNIYAQAYLVIAADGAPDSMHGLSPSRPRPCVSFKYSDPATTLEGELQAFKLALESERDYPTTVQLLQEPLSQRGWSLQERALARRTVHFASDQMHFECREEFRSQDGFCVPGSLSPIYASQDAYLADSWRAAQPVRSRHSRDVDRWYEIVEDYTYRDLSHATDRLPALSGLARIFTARTGALYVAGLWSTALIEGLQWIAKGQSTMEDLAISPSWSWACRNQPATNLRSADGLQVRDVATILDFHVETSSTNQFGELKFGWIAMQAPVLPLRLVPEQTDRGPGWLFSFKIPGGTFNADLRFEGTVRGYLDYPVAWTQQQTLFAVLLSQRLWNPPDQPEATYQHLRTTAALIVTQGEAPPWVPQPVSEFTSARRVGVIDYQAWHLKVQEPWLRDIVLV